MKAATATALTPEAAAIVAKCRDRKDALRTVTSVMKTAERFINFYNRKYAFEIERGTAKEQREFATYQATWDRLKVVRDELKAA